MTDKNRVDYATFNCSSPLRARGRASERALRVPPRSADTSNRVKVTFARLRVAEEAISLSRTLSRSRLAHQIHGEFEGFDTRSHDTWDHRILHVLDLDCDYATRLLLAVRFERRVRYRKHSYESLHGIR